MLDLSKLTPDSGTDLEYDSRYQELENLMTSGSDSSVIEIDGVSGETEVDFLKVIDLCEQLWKETRDLRVATYFSIASLNKQGLKGFVSGLEVILYLISELWDSFYPRLDDEDDRDPTERINILSSLTPKADAFDDPIGFVKVLNKLKLFDSYAYTYRDLQIATGAIKSNDSFDFQDLEAAAVSLGDKLLAPCEQCASILNLVSQIESLMNEKMGGANFISFEGLKGKITQLSDFYNKYASFGQQAINAANPETESEEGLKRDISVDAAAEVKRFGIKNRKEALLLIQMCSDYFSKHEPTSPVPYLLQRALRMADMNFVDLLLEIDQNAFERGKEQLGIKSSENNEF